MNPRLGVYVFHQNLDESGTGSRAWRSYRRAPTCRIAGKVCNGPGELPEGAKGTGPYPWHCFTRICHGALLHRKNDLVQLTMIMLTWEKFNKIEENPFGYIRFYLQIIPGTRRFFLLPTEHSQKHTVWVSYRAKCSNWEHSSRRVQRFTISSFNLERQGRHIFFPAWFPGPACVWGLQSAFQDGLDPSVNSVRSKSRMRSSKEVSRLAANAYGLVGIWSGCEGCPDWQ